MDKSLKHLSRLDLLELMVKLSEENEALAKENSRLKHDLAAKPVMTRATKVGSIAELALQANGYFEAAQRSADDYLREIKRMRDQVVARAPGEAIASSPVQPAQSRSAASGNMTVGSAQAQANAIVARANAQAESILNGARAKSETMLADANRQARSIISRANHQADAVVQAAYDDARRRSASRISTTAAAGQSQPAHQAHAASSSRSARKDVSPNQAGAKTANSGYARKLSSSTSGDSLPTRGRHARLA